MRTSPNTRRRLATATALAVLGLGAMLAPFLPATAGDETCVEVGKSRLFLRLPDAFVKQDVAQEGCVYFAAGALEGSAVDCAVWVRSRKEAPYKSPEDVAKDVEESEKKNGHGPAKGLATKRPIGGSYGEGGYGILGIGAIPDPESKTGELIVLCGLLDQHGYYVRVSATPAFAPEMEATFVETLRTAVRAEVPGLDPRWTDAEARARWASEVRDPALAKQMKPPTRTAHYIVLTNTGAGPRFGALMEKNFAALSRIFPDDIGAKPRLLPVFVFAKAEDFHAHYVATSHKSMEDARAHTGFGYADFYSTYEESRNDWQHVRGAAGQYFQNILRLDGGGWWFRQAMMRYVFLKPNDVKTLAQDIVRRHAWIPLEKAIGFVGSGKREEQTYLDQGASLLAFLREGDLAPEKFPQFVRRVYSLPACDAVALEPILKDLYDKDLAGLEAAWAAHWSK